MLEIGIKIKGKKNRLVLAFEEEALRRGDDFLLLLDKFLKRSKINFTTLEGLEILKGGENLGLTSRRIIETALTVLNASIKQVRHFT